MHSARLFAPFREKSAVQVLYEQRANFVRFDLNPATYLNLSVYRE